MSSEDLYNTAIGDLFLKIKYYAESNLEERKIRAELTRTQTFFLVNLQLSEKDKYESPQKMWSFEWDKEPQEPISEKEQKESIDRLSELANKIEKIWPKK